MRSKFFPLSLVICCGVVLGLPQVAQADPLTYETFVFTGTCTGCTSAGVGVLTLTNYALDTPLTTANFVSFLYSSSDIPTPVDITLADLTRFTGSIGANGAYAVKIREVGVDFASRTTGGWCIAVNPGVAVSCSPDQLSTSNWRVTPEPGTFSLLGLGMAGLGLVRRRFGSGHPSPINGG